MSSSFKKRLSSLKARLSGERIVDDLYDIEMVERIVGKKFDSTPEIRVCSPRKYRKIVSEMPDSQAAAKVKQNKIYIPKSSVQPSESKPFIDEYCVVHELGEIMFNRRSRLSQKLDEEKLYEDLIISNTFFGELYRYLSNRLSQEDSAKLESDPESNHVLNRFTRTALSHGFSDMLARIFLQKKYGNSGFMAGIRYTYVSESLIDKIEQLPDSYEKVLLAFQIAGTILANNNYGESGLQYLLSIDKDQLPSVRKMLTKYYVRVLETSLQKR